MTTKIVTTNEIGASSQETLTTGNALIIPTGILVGNTATAGSAITSGVISGASITVNGTVFGDACINMSNATGTALMIGSQGSLIAGTKFVGISLGAQTLLTNAGQITGSIILHDHSYVTNSGSMIDTNVALEIQGGQNVVFNSGTISATAGSDAIEIEQDAVGGNQISNSGVIMSDRIAVDLAGTGGGNHISNSNIVTASNQAIAIHGGNNIVTNSGHITSTNSAAISFDSLQTDLTDTVRNLGTLESTASTAIGFGAAAFVIINSGDIIGGIFGSQSLNNSKIVNSGAMTGVVEFGSGDDSYDGRLGHIDGAVLGGAGSDTMKGGAAADSFSGDAGSDVLKGYDGEDILTGGGGSDRLDGGAGIDTFAYGAVGDSTSGNYDIIIGFSATDDLFDLNVAVNRIDPTVTAGALNAASIDTDLSAALTAAQLGAHRAVLFTPNSGDLKGHTFLVVDANGTAGYQATKDYVFDLVHAADLTTLSVDNFG